MKVSLRTGFGMILVIFVIIHTNSSIDLPDEQSDPVCDALLEFCATCKSLKRSCSRVNRQCEDSRKHISKSRKNSTASVSASPKDAMAAATAALKEASGTMTGVSDLKKPTHARRQNTTRRSNNCRFRAFCSKCEDEDILDACKQAVDC